MTKKILILFSFLVFSPQIWAQATGNSQASDTVYDLGLKTGSFLPYEIIGVRELLPIWGIKFGHSFSESLRFEYDLDIAHAKGVTYTVAYASIRHDFNILDTLPLFALVGFDFHRYKRKNTAITNTEFPFKTSTGWHVGIGGENRLFGDLFFRVDIRLGFSPGRQMTLTGGVVLRF